ncbi:MAG: oxygen-dependent coproporphyrinogen oxidase [Myxococcales bacterium]|nr:oxygen-dependent coproporphyrinogen oxidase [Myxococcales bacterium]MCB9704689.1 oxygen-dependent coproporphyrinogen oxidase [Myxococcales bacterium]
MQSSGELSELQARASATVRAIQDAICGAIEGLEREQGSQAGFIHDRWEREGGGGGESRVLRGEVIEKGGVNVSTVFGELSPDFASQLPGSGTHFFATGVSLVIHPRNPHVPTTHANFRYIEHGERRWIGGGGDLTPYYFHAEDKEHFHAVWRRLCEAHPEIADYPAWSEWCDRYFFLKHRGERRGIGGIFFDYVDVDPSAPGHAEARIDFLRAGGQAFIDAFIPIARRRVGTAWTPEQRRWQELRRGRYVEFNLLYDRGTIFGLRTGGRTESILMSLPPHVQWGYCEEPNPGTPEARLLEELRRPPPVGPVSGV